MEKVIRLTSVTSALPKILVMNFEVFRCENFFNTIFKSAPAINAITPSNGVPPNRNEKLPLPRPQKKTSVHLLQVGIALHSSKRVHASFRDMTDHAARIIFIFICTRKNSI